MTAIPRMRCTARLLLVVGLLMALAGNSQAQFLNLFEWNPIQPGNGDDWDWVGPNENQTNWVSSSSGNRFIPNNSGFPGEGALIGNGGTARVSGSVPQISELHITNGELLIEGNGTLVVAPPAVGSGNAIVSPNGRVTLSGAGSLTVGNDFFNYGTVTVNGGSTTTNIAGDLHSYGTMVATLLHANNHGTVNVSGTASLGGTLRVNVQAISPSYGSSWDIISASSLVGDFNEIDVQGDLGRGLRLSTTQSGGTYSVEVTNSLILSVDRTTGLTTVKNVVGDAINLKGYGVFSNNGLLSPTGWDPLTTSAEAGAGWVPGGTASAMKLGEVNLTGHSMAVGSGGDVSLGALFDRQNATLENADLTFEYVTDEGVFSGAVEYTGAPNMLTLHVDPVTGEAVIGNLSPFITPPSLIHYSIRSASGALLPGTWNSLQDQGAGGGDWLEANPSSELLAELKLEGSQILSYGSIVDMGAIFSPSSEQDLVFEFQTVDGSVQQGYVLYEGIPDAPDGQPGDFNNDGRVDAADYTVWRNNLGGNESVLNGNGNDSGVVDEGDYTLWKSHFGSSSLSTAALTAAGAQVPEPVSFVSAVLLVSGLMVGYRHARRA